MELALNTFFRLAFVTSAIVALSVAPIVPARTADAAPFDIDVLLTLTGPSTFIGKADQDSLNVLEALVNRQGGIRGRPLHFNYYDDKTDAQTSVELANSIVQKHPAVIIGSSNVANCRATGPLIAAAGPVQYCLSPSLHPASGSYAFVTSNDTKDMVSAYVRYFRERGWKRIALLASTDAGGQDADTNFANVLAMPENKSVSLVAHEHFNNPDLSVAAQLSRVKAAAPQVLVLWASGTPFGTLLHGLVESGIDLPIAAQNANMSYASMKQFDAILPKELYFPGLPFLAGQAPTRQARDAQRVFFDAFAAAGIKPDFITSTSWDPAFIVVSAFRALGTSATPDQLRSYINGLHGFYGVAGDYDFRDGSQRGLAERNVMIMRWDPAKNGWTAVSQLGGMPIR